jgi:hypothetical protein
LEGICLKLNVSGRLKLGGGGLPPPPRLARSKNVKYENGLRIEKVMVS